jgi:regulator of replication initiation timing
MLRIELQIEGGAVVIGLPEESTDSSDTLKVELESLKDELAMKQVSNEALAREGDELRAEVLLLREQNKTAIGRCAAKQDENDCLRDMHTSQRIEIEIYAKQIKEAETANRMLKVDNDKLRERLYVKYYPADVLIKAEKERDDLQTKLNNLKTWLTCLRDKTYRTVDL